MSEKIAVEYVEELADYFHLIDEFSFSGEGYVIKRNGNFIGLIKGDESLENEGVYFIDEIRIVESERSKGYGITAIGRLKDQLNVTRIEGVSVPESKGFWAKLGANFYERCLICPFNNDCEEKKSKASKKDCEEYDMNYFITDENRI